MGGGFRGEEASNDNGVVITGDFCLCNAMLCICIGQNIKSRKPVVRPSICPSVRPASVDKNVT